MREEENTPTDTRRNFH